MERVKKYLVQGIGEAKVKEKARWKTAPAVKKEFFDMYADHLWEYKTLESNQVHQDILEVMEERLSDGVDIHHSVKRAVAKHKHEFEGLNRELDEESSEEEGEEEEEEAADPHPGTKLFSYR